MIPLSPKFVSSSFDNLRKFDRCSNKNGVVNDIFSCAKCLMGCELWIPKPGRVGILLWPMKTRPLGIWRKVLPNMSLFACIRRLLDQSQCYVAQERPFQKRIVLSDKKANVQREMCAFPAPVAVREGDNHKLVPVLICVERWTVNFIAADFLRSLQTSREFINFPQQLPLIEGFAVFDHCLKLTDLFRLFHG